MAQLTITTTYRMDATVAHPETPQGWSISGIVDDADAIVALFPKSTGLKATKLHRPINGSYTNGSESVPYIRADGNLIANGVNGGINETGLRRLRSILKVAEQHGITLEYVTDYANSYPTFADFEAAINQ